MEVAKTPGQLERGLMYRLSMGDDRGMLFRMEERKVHVFWMHNTCIPLDILFIDGDGTITGILENVPVLNDEARNITCPSSYVLEVNAGWVERHSVAPGQRVKLPVL